MTHVRRRRRLVGNISFRHRSRQENTYEYGRFLSKPLEETDTVERFKAKLENGNGSKKI